MVFYLNYLSNEEKFYNFNIYFKKRLNKLDKNFVNLMLETYSQKEDTFIEVDILSIKKILKLNSEDEMFDYFDKFMQTKIYYSFFNAQNYKFQGAFHILDSFFMKKNAIVFVLSKELTLSFDENNLFNKINLRCILKLRSSCSLNIYLTLLNLTENIDEGSIDFDLDGLKKMLEVTNSYERFYDFEKKVLEPTLEDLNENSEYQISFSKIKKSENSSGKILGITLHYVNNKVRETKKQCNFLVSLVKENVQNFELIYNTIYDNLKIYGYDYVYGIINSIGKTYSKKEHKSFDKFLIETLANSLINEVFQGDEDKPFVIEKIIHTPYDIYIEVNKVLAKMNLGVFANDHLIFSSFFKEISKLEDGGHYHFESNGMKIEFFFKKRTKSRIEISKANLNI